MIRRVGLFLIPLALSAAANAAVGGPGVLGRVMPGIWEVSARADGHDAERICLTNPRVLLQWEHRGANCGYRVLANDPSGAMVDYNCGQSGFGHSRLTMLTPRTVKVESQGISSNFPFKQTLHARRIGDCPAR